MKRSRTEIRSGYLSNESLERYRYINLLYRLIFVIKAPTRDLLPVKERQTKPTSRNSVYFFCL
jgi:hypothetical protein